MTTTTGDTINGSFGTLDFSALSYLSRATASFNSASGVLTVTSGQNYESLTLTNPGAASFAVGSDGKGGTTVAGAGGNTYVIGNAPAGPSTTSPTDSFQRITVGNTQLASSSGATGTFSGSTVLDLTKGTSQGAFSFTFGGQTETFSNPNVATEQDGTEFVYGLADGSMDDFGIFFNGPYFSGAPSLDVATGVTGPGPSGVGTSYSGQPAITAVPVCFASGTSIATARGDVAVEDLRVGDVAVTSSGEHRPIRWIGSRTMDPRRHPRSHEAQPVRVAAHAFGPGRPARDLRVSPGHALGFDVLGEVLVPAGALVDGAAVVQEDVGHVTYWHVELDGHDLLLAEGLPAESYLDMGNRAFFAGSAVVDLAASPDAAPRPHAGFCRPFHGGGPVVEALRAAMRAGAPGAPAERRRGQRATG